MDLGFCRPGSRCRWAGRRDRFLAGPVQVVHDVGHVVNTGMVQIVHDTGYVVDAALITLDWVMILEYFHSISASMFLIAV